MRWLHFSDIHFNFDGYDTSVMREKLLKYICDNIHEAPDAVFITGDLRFARDTNEFKEETKMYINKLIDSFDRNCPYYIAAGNHDVNRSRAREDVIRAARNNYSSSNGDFKKDYYQRLLPDFNSFRSFITDSAGPIINDDYLHRFIQTNIANIICINTSITSGFDSADEYGQLIIGIKNLEECLNKIDKNKPTIVFGHHSIESLRYDESIRVIDLFQKHNIHIYLCGHNHSFKVNNISYDENYVIYELFVGNLYTEDRFSQCGFLEVEYLNNQVCIMCHEWDYNNRRWHLSNTYSNDFDGTTKVLKLYNNLKNTRSRQNENHNMLQRVMMISNKNVAITLPVYEKKSFTNQWPFVHYNEYAYTLKLINAISISGLNIETDYSVNYQHSEIHIGGPTVNINTYQYIRNFLPSYKAYIKKDFIPNNLCRISKDFIVESENSGFSVQDKSGNEMGYFRQDNKNDIGIIIRLKINEQKTVHLIF